MEIYLKFKQQLINRDNNETEIILTNLRNDFENAIKNFDKKLQEINNEDFDKQLLFYTHQAIIFGMFKSKVDDSLFDKIHVNHILRSKLIEVDSVYSIVTTLNEKTHFHFKKTAIISFFYDYTYCFLLEEIGLILSRENPEFKVFYEDFKKLVKKVKRQLNENVDLPRKENRLFYKLLTQQRIKHDVHLNQHTFLKPFTYSIGKYFSHPHKLVYQPLVKSIKEYNQDLLKEAFNETELYVALYNLLKAISYNKESYRDDDKNYVEDYFKNNVNNYKTKIVRNWFS